MGLGGEDDDDTAKRIADYEAKHGAITDEQIIDGIVAVMRQDAFNHRDLQSIDGRRANGMSVMFMGASTGCNTVYGSTPPSNPHPYPWMNSLFQDGATIIVAARRIAHREPRAPLGGARTPGRRAARPRRKASCPTPICSLLTHLDDALMTDQEIRELPKVWVIGGDGALGDIGFQNVSKVILQNRPNVKMLMLDTQVYSNTGGQNSDSSTMLGGYDMNQFGVASQGKLIEKKNVAEAFTSGHGSPFVAQVSMANAAKLYKAMLDGLEYRGTAFFQAYTTCQPEHGVPDNMSADQAKLVRDARGMPEFVFNPRNGETAQEAFDLKGNPTPNRDWWRTKYQGDRRGIQLHRGALGASPKPASASTSRPSRKRKRAELIHLDDMLVLITQDDVIYRRVFDPNHRRFVPNFGCYIKAEINGQDEVFRREPADGALRRGTPQSLAHAAKQSRRGEQGLPRAKSVARETRQRRIATRRCAGENKRTIRRRTCKVKLAQPRGVALRGKARPAWRTKITSPKKPCYQNLIRVSYSWRMCRRKRKNCSRPNSRN